MILSSFTVRNQDILKKAICTYMRPILEYCSSIWNPHKKYLIGMIERIQRIFTKAVASHPYMNRRRLLNLPTLEKLRFLADLSLCFKLRRGLLNCTAFFSLLPSTYSRTRSHNFKLGTGKIRCETTKNFFCNRVVRSWNSLPADIVNSFSVSRFDWAIRELNLNQYLTYK